jgi:hypothetical protein
MKYAVMLLAALGLAGPLEAQSFTGEFRVLPLGAHAGQPTLPPGNEDPNGSPAANTMGGVIGDVSFILGRFRLGPEAFVLRGTKRRVWGLGGLARYQLTGGSVRPYALLGAGWYFWDRPIVIDVPPVYTSWGSDVNPLTMSVGGGLQLGARDSRLAAIAELRYHRTLQTQEFSGHRAMVSLGLGGRVAW